MPYIGGQVARGGQLGLLGNKDYMDTPYSLTSYTEKTIRDQQATSVAAEAAGGSGRAAARQEARSQLSQL